MKRLLSPRSTGIVGSSPWATAALAFGVFVLSSSNVARAGQEYYEASVQVQSLSWTRTLSLPQFDPRKGVLEMVVMEVDAGMASDVRVENRNNGGRLTQKYAPVTASVTASLTLRLPNETLLVKASPSLSKTYNLSAKFDGKLDYAGFSGYTDNNLESSQSTSHTFYLGQDDLTPFIGVGNVDLTLRANGSGKVQGPGNLIYRIVNRAGGTLTVCYIYRGSEDAPPPPPPPPTCAGTIGFWGNPNGKKAIEALAAAGKDPYGVLSDLHLKNDDGSDFDPTTFGELRLWLRNVDATKMWYMLSAQLAAFQLNVLCEAFGDWPDPFNPPLPEPENLISWADSLLEGYDETFRAEQEYIKDLLDCANNNFADGCWPVPE